MSANPRIIVTDAQTENLDPLAQEFVRLVRKADAPGVAAFLSRESGFKPRLYEPLFDFDAPAIVLCGWRNDRAMADVLLDAGADPNERSQWWAGGFHVLDTCGPEFAAHLISRGATLDICSASHLGYEATVREMLAENPLVVYTRGGDGMTPLHVAATVPIAKLLVEEGADIEAKDADHVSTPAQWALKDRHDVCRYLIEQGATEDPFMAAAIGDVPYLRAALAEDPKLIDARIDEAQFPCPGSSGGHIYNYVLAFGNSMLHAAVRYGQAETATFLIAAGMSPSVRGGYDDATPLHAAAWQGQPAMVKFLVNSGADIDADSGRIHHNTPLGWAIVAGKADVVRVLLELGAKQRDYHIGDAGAAIAGRFRSVAPGALDSDRREILSMLEAAR